MAPMHSMPVGGFAAMGVFFLLWVVMMGVGLSGWIVFLIALWRGMKAHERIAKALDTLAERLPGRIPS